MLRPLECIPRRGELGEDLSGTDIYRDTYHRTHTYKERITADLISDKTHTSVAFVDNNASLKRDYCKTSAARRQKVGGGGGGAAQRRPLAGPYFGLPAIR